MFNGWKFKKIFMGVTKTERNKKRLDKKEKFDHEGQFTCELHVYKHTKISETLSQIVVTHAQNRT
jgi:hypothetical protein